MQYYFRLFRTKTRMSPQCSAVHWHCIALPPQLSCQQHVASGYCSWCTVHMMWWEKNAIWYLWSALFSTVVQNMTGVFHEQDVVRCYCPGPGVSQVQSNFHVSKYISFHSPSSLPHHLTTSQLLQLSTLAHTWAFRHDALVWVAAAPGADHGIVTRHVSGVGRCSGWRIRYTLIVEITCQHDHKSINEDNIINAHTVSS